MSCLTIAIISSHESNLPHYTCSAPHRSQSDMKPGVFWTATPSNFWRDNVACHSTNFGFWFELEGSTDEGE